MLLFRTLGTNFREILCEFHAFSFKEMHKKMSPSCEMAAISMKNSFDANPALFIDKYFSKRVMLSNSNTPRKHRNVSSPTYCSIYISRLFAGLSEKYRSIASNNLCEIYMWRQNVAAIRLTFVGQSFYLMLAYVYFPNYSHSAGALCLYAGYYDIITETYLLN